MILALAIVLVPVVGWGHWAAPVAGPKVPQAVSIRVVDEGVLSPLTERVRVWLVTAAGPSLSAQP